MCGDRDQRRAGAWLWCLILPVAIALPSAAAAQGDWGTRFLSPGAEHWVYATTVFNGDLVIGGNFMLVDDCPATRVARFDGTRWAPMGAGFNGIVRCLYVFDDELYAGGDFDSSGTTAVNRVARWDGASWQPLGTGITGQGARVYTMLGHRQQLLVGGEFGIAGGELRESLARWDGATWQDFFASSGFSYAGAPGTVRKLLEFNGQPVAVGRFDDVDGRAARNAAWWSGSHWESMAALGQASHTATAALVYRGRLLAANSSRVYQWTGISWMLFSQEAVAVPYDMIEFDGDLVIAGSISAFNHIARWDGQAWQELGAGLWGPYWDDSSMRAHSLCIYNDMLVVGSTCKFAGERSTFYLSAWDGSQWVAPTDPEGIGAYAALDRPVGCFAEYQGKLIAGGGFTFAYGVPLYAVGAWDGTAWSPLAGGFPHRNHSVYDLCAFNDGLVAVGNLAPFEDVAFWDGHAWDELGYQFNWSVFVACVHEGDLYVGGDFTEDEHGDPFLHIAQWGGVWWWPLGAYGLNDIVRALCSYAGDLIAAGEFTEAGGQPADHIARWDGYSWHALGEGVNGAVSVVQVFGDSLIVAGDFTEAGGQPARHLACWDGQGWSDLNAEPDGTVYAITEYHGDLVIGGSFARLGAEPVACLARWDGESWREMGRGVEHLGGATGSVYELQVLGDRLYVSGQFHLAGERPAHFLACWEEAPNGSRGHWIPAADALEQNYPNPFNPETRIPFRLRAAGPVQLDILDIGGRVVRTLVDGTLPAGEHAMLWDGRDDRGVAQASGIYHGRLTAGGRQESLKMVLLK